VKRKNVMYNGEPGQNNPDTSSAVGSSKAFTVKIKSTTALPSCLNTCNPAFPLVASDVKTGFCYIDRHCYADGNAAPYAGDECRKCDASATPLSWSDPVTTSFCFIGDKCVAEGAHAQVGYSCMGRYGPSTCYRDDPCSKCIPSASGTAYSPVAENGCMVSTTHAVAQRPRRPDTMSFAAMSCAALAVRSWTWPRSPRLATTTKGI